MMNNDIERDSGLDEDDVVRRLLSQAGERPRAPAAMKERVRNNVFSEWQKHTAKQVAGSSSRNRPRQLLRMSAAAVLVLALGLTVTLLNPRNSQDDQTIATVEKIDGKALYATGAGWQVLSAGQPLSAGMRLRVPADSKLALTWGQASVRVDEGTEFRIEHGRRLVLDAGQLYVDTGVNAGKNQIAGEPMFTVVTRHGEAKDTGTQFLVGSTMSEMVVAVREGMVDIQHEHSATRAVAEEQVTVSAVGAVDRQTIEADDGRWDWVIALSPPYTIENARLKDFLVWASRELGKPLEFGSPVVEQGCELTVLHGDIGDLSLEQALSAVLATTRYRLDSNSGDAITVVER